MRWPHRVAVRVSRADERLGADGQDVWSRHPDAGVLVGDDVDDGGNKPGPLGERGAAVSPSRREGRLFGQSCGSCRLHFFRRRAMGAACTRPSLRPLIEGATNEQSPDATCAAGRR